MRQLTCFVGPVNSGKSTRAAQAANRLQRLGFRVILLRPSCSIRAHECAQPGRLVTKNGVSFPATNIERAADIVDIARGSDVVWIDEPMLFADEERVFESVQLLRRSADILISGLSATSELEPFGYSMPRLIAVADEVVFCRSDCDVCKSFGTATRSICLKPKDGQILVGGTETFNAACPTCWHGHVSRLDATNTAKAPY